jgi:hypothetical protein
MLRSPSLSPHGDQCGNVAEAAGFCPLTIT